jgi:hypothetical protein
MRKTLSTLLWIKGREKADNYFGSHTYTQKISASIPTFVGFFVCGMMGRFGYGSTINGKSNA